MASLGTLTLDLVAKTAGFVQGMDKAERASAKWRKQVGRDIQRVSKALGTTLKVSSVAAVAGLTLIINRSMQAIDEQAKLAKQLNTTSNSIATLKRAGELSGVSLQQVGVAARTLDVSIGRAAQGVGRQAEALATLGLEADDLIGLPLDDKILKINQALRDNVTEAERAAVAADLFGTRNGAAIQQLDVGTIERAKEETKLFGLALSDVDAAKVEEANDSFSRFGVAATGIGQQLTIAVAPAIDAVGDKFFDAAQEAGGIGAAVEGGVDRAVRAIAFIVNAIDGVKRTFQLLANTGVLAFIKIKEAALNGALIIAKAYDRLPFTDVGADIAKLEQEIAVSAKAAEFVIAENRRLLEEPLAGNALVEGFEAAKVKAQEAAEAAVAARNAASQSSSQGPNPFDQPQEDFAFDPAVFGPQDEGVFGQPQEDFAFDPSIFDERESQYETHKQNLLEIEQSYNGQLSQAARQLAGEQSGIYRALFAVEKGAAIARSIVAIQTALANASASGPFPANLAAIAQVASATAGIVSTIASTQIQGQAHDGLMSVPKTGTYLLEKGERVTTAETSAKLDQKLDGMGGGGVRIINSIDPSLMNDFLGSSQGEKTIMNVIRKNQRTISALSFA